MAYVHTLQVHASASAGGAGGVAAVAVQVAAAGLGVEHISHARRGVLTNVHPPHTHGPSLPPVPPAHALLRAAVPSRAIVEAPA